MPDDANTISTATEAADGGAGLLEEQLSLRAREGEGGDASAEGSGTNLRDARCPALFLVN